MLIALLLRWMRGLREQNDRITHFHRLHQEELNLRNDFWKDSLSHYEPRTWT